MRDQHPGAPGESWNMTDAMLCRVPEPFTKGWTGMFTRYSGPILILDECVDKEELSETDEYAGRAWRVLTNRGIYFIAFGWLDKVATRIDRDVKTR